MTLQRLASEIARREGKKTEIPIGNVREVLRILVDLEVESIRDGWRNDGPASVILDRAEYLFYDSLKPAKPKRAAKKARGKK